MDLCQKVTEVLDTAECRMDTTERKRLEQINARLEQLTDKGFIERPSYNLSSTAPVPHCTWLTR